MVTKENRFAQSLAESYLALAIACSGVTPASTGLAGEDPGECYFGCYADFEGSSPRRVHVYQDDDGEFMIDAMDAEVGSPAPAPYSRPLLVVYLIWAAGGNDGAFLELAQAGQKVAL